MQVSNEWMRRLGYAIDDDFGFLRLFSLLNNKFQQLSRCHEKIGDTSDDHTKNGVSSMFPRLDQVVVQMQP